MELGLCCFSWVSHGQNESENEDEDAVGQEATRQTIANQNIALALN